MARPKPAVRGEAAASEASDTLAATGTVEDAEDVHRHIPRDENGDPIFLILPAGIRQSYERRMKRCERGWGDRQDPAAVRQAMNHIAHFRQVPPAWFVEAVRILAKDQRSARDVKREREAMIHMLRYQAVRDFMWVFEGNRRIKRTAGNSLDGKMPTWDRAYSHAAEVLAGGPAAGEPIPTMKASYQRVRRDLTAGRGGLYFMTLPERVLGKVATAETEDSAALEGEVTKTRT
jgi:hypothetical protein